MESTREGEARGGSPRAGEKILGRYRVERVLGEGATAIVCLARDDSLGRAVAVKVLREEGKGAVEIRRLRFLRESRILARLKHPNLLTLFEAGEHEGHFCQVLEFVDGGSLEEVFDRSPFTARDLAALLEKSALAVHAAHRAGVVHRDLKPGNILLSSSGEPKVADFGLSHLDDATRLTWTGTLIGTPRYMAPEQVAAECGPVGPRTDVFALGTILYEGLVGHPPHMGESVRLLFDQIRTEEPVPPRRIDPTIPEAIETIALRALAKDPRRRYASAEAFAADLRAFLEDRPLVARREGSVSRLVRRMDMRVTSAAASVLVVAVALLVGLGFRNVRTAGPAEPADAGLAERRAEAVERLELGRAALDAAIVHLYRPGGRLEEYFGAVERGRIRIEEAVAIDPDLVAAHHHLGRAWDLAGWEDRAQACWRRAVELDPGFAPARLALARLLLVRASSAVFLVADAERAGTSRGEVERRIVEARSELSHVARSTPGDAGLEDEMPRTLAAALAAYADGRSEEVRSIAREATERFGQAPGAEEFHWLAALVEDGETAIAHCSRALALCPRHWLSLYQRGCLRRRAGDVEGALADYGATLEIRPRFGFAWFARGILFASLGALDRAVEDYGRAIELDPGFSEAWHNRAEARAKLGEFEAARSDYDEAVRLEPDEPLTRAGRGVLRRRMGDDAGAREDLDRAVALGPQLALAWAYRAALRSEADDPAGAGADYDEAIRLDGSNTSVRLARARLRWTTGDATGALSDCERALDLAPESVDALGLRGLLLAEAGELERALLDLDRALRTAPPGWPLRDQVEAARAEARARTGR